NRSGGSARSCAFEGYGMTRYRNAIGIGPVLALVAAAGLAAPPAAAEVFVDIGAQSTRIEAKIANQDEKIDTTESGLHLGIGASRAFGERSEIGVRLELDDLGSDWLLAVRALDYRRHVGERIAIGAFLGAARLDL